MPCQRAPFGPPGPRRWLRGDGCTEAGIPTSTTTKLHWRSLAGFLKPWSRIGMPLKAVPMEPLPGKGQSGGCQCAVVTYHQKGMVECRASAVNSTCMACNTRDTYKTHWLSFSRDSCSGTGSCKILATQQLTKSAASCFNCHRTLGHSTGALLMMIRSRRSVLVAPGRGP